MNPLRLYEASSLVNTPLSVAPSELTKRWSKKSESRIANDVEPGQVNPELVPSTVRSEAPSQNSPLNQVKIEEKLPSGSTYCSPPNSYVATQPAWAGQQPSHRSWLHLPQLTTTNLTKLSQASASSILLPSHATDTGTVRTGTATFGFGADNTFGEDGSHGGIPSPDRSSHARELSTNVLPVPLETIDAQTIFSSTYSQTSLEDLHLSAVSNYNTRNPQATSHEASSYPIVHSVQPETVLNAPIHCEPPVSHKLHVPPSIHSFHTQPEAVSSWQRAETDDIHSIANASIYESCISASHAHSVCATTAQTYAASSTLAETVQAKEVESEAGQPGIASSSSMKRILSDFKIGTVHSVKSSKSIQYLGSIAAVKKRLSLFTQKSREDSSQFGKSAEQAQVVEAAQFDGSPLQPSASPDPIVNSDDSARNTVSVVAAPAAKVPGVLLNDTKATLGAPQQGSVRETTGAPQPACALFSVTGLPGPFSQHSEECAPSVLCYDEPAAAAPHRSSEPHHIPLPSQCIPQPVPQQILPVQHPAVEDSEAIFDLYNYHDVNVPPGAPRKRILSPVVDVSEPESTPTVKSHPTNTESRPLAGDNQDEPQPEVHFTQSLPSQPIPEPTSRSCDQEALFSRLAELLQNSSMQQAAYAADFSSQVGLVQSELLAISERTHELPSFEKYQSLLESVLTEMQKTLENTGQIGHAKMNELEEMLVVINSGIAQLQETQEARLVDAKDGQRQSPELNTLPALPPIPQDEILKDVENHLLEIKECIKERKPLLDVLEKLDGLLDNRTTRNDVESIKEKLDQLLDKSTAIIEQLGEVASNSRAQVIANEPDDNRIHDLHNEPKSNTEDKSKDIETDATSGEQPSPMVEVRNLLE